MDLILNNLRVPVEKDEEREYILAAAEKINISPTDIKFIKILNKALDARDQKQFYYELSIAVSLPEDFKSDQKLSYYIEPLREAKEPKNLKNRPLIVGFGPAGIFAALELIEYGIKPIIFERGKKIEDRALDVQKFIKEGKLNPESNIQDMTVAQLKKYADINSIDLGDLTKKADIKNAIEVALAGESVEAKHTTTEALDVLNSHKSKRTNSQSQRKRFALLY